MTQPNMLQPLLDQLVGEDLSGVTFVRDYLQLQFNPPPQLNVYSDTVVACDGVKKAAFHEEGFGNLIVSFIGRVVRAVEVEDEQAIRIIFADDSQVEISLRPESNRRSEAIYWQGRDGLWAVI